MTDLSCPACPICGHDASTPGWTDPVWLRAVFVCEACASGFVSPPLEYDLTDAPASLYQSDFASFDFDVGKAIIYELARYRVDPVEQPGLSLLDVGCGPGHVLVHFRAHGWTVQGVEPWRALADIGRKYYRVPIVDARIERADVEPGMYDVVLALDALQYAAEPRAFLAACMAALRPGGTFYATVPNFGSAARRRDGWNWPYLLTWCYMSYFTEEGLRRLCEEAGLYRVGITPFAGPDGNDVLRVLATKPLHARPGLDDVRATIEDSDLPLLDRAALDETFLTDAQKAWRTEGCFVARGLLPADLVGRSRAPVATGNPSVLDTEAVEHVAQFKPLADLIDHLLIERVEICCASAGGEIVEGWGQDALLIDAEHDGHGVAVCIALAPMGEGASAMTVVPGSHRWPPVDRHRVRDGLRGEDDDPQWPRDARRLLAPLFAQEMTARKAVERVIALEPGDVMIRHRRLLFRGPVGPAPLVTIQYGVMEGPDRSSARRHLAGQERMLESMGRAKPAANDSEHDD